MINKLIQDRIRKFWNCDTFGDQFNESVERVYKIIILFQLFLAILGIICWFLLLLKPIFTENPFIMDIWTPSYSIVLDTVILATQYYVLGVSMFIVYGYDFIYFALLIDITLQVVFLNRKLQNLVTATKSIKSDVFKYIEYHQFLLA